MDLKTITNDESNNEAELTGGVRPVFDLVPSMGEAIEVATGVWWLRLPLTSSLDHVNVYLLDDNEALTLIDTGSNTEPCRLALQAVIDREPFCDRQITRVIATHYHPDHIGLAGLLVDRGAMLYATRLCWLYAKMLQLDDRELPCAEQIQFVERAGLKGMALAAYRRRRPSNFSRLVMPLPFSFLRISENDILNIGSRKWTVHIGNGHAAGHATLWSNDGLAVTGDQIIPGISSNLSVHPSEPQADLVTEWNDSTRKFMSIANDSTLCLPGHNTPFTGAVTRCEQLIASQEAVLQRLLTQLARPSSAVECLETVYRRPLSAHEQGALIAETVGFLNHLQRSGLVRYELTSDNVHVWQRVHSQASQVEGHEMRIEDRHELKRPSQQASINKGNHVK